MGSSILERRAIASGLKHGLTFKVAKLIREIRANKVCYLFLAPFALIFTIFTVIPVLMSLALSFTHFDMIQPPRWVGWDNYIRLFLEDEVFLIAVQNTFIFAAIIGPFSYMASLLFAWLINELRPRIRAVLTLLFFAPSISGNAFLIWTIMFSGDAHGYINGFLLYWGIVDTPVQWFIDPSFMMPTVILVVLWMSLSISFLAFIAGLQGIDETLYEAGAIDGIRNRWQELWYLTLPAMRPQLLFGAIMSITASFAASGQIIALVGFPDTEYATRTVVTHLLDHGNIRFEMGYAASIATLLFFSMIWAQKIVQKLLRKIG